MDREKKELTAEQLDTATGGVTVIDGEGDKPPRQIKLTCMRCQNFSTFDMDAYAQHLAQCQAGGI